MATRSKKKPAKRKPKATGSNRVLTTFGWVAAGLVGVGWAASDGRPARYVSSAVHDARQAMRTEETVDRVAALIQSEPKPKFQAAQQTTPARSRPSIQSEERTGSIRPTPRPSSDIGRSEAAIPLPTNAPLLPLQAPPVAYVLRESRPVSASAANVPAGEERHATRALAAHAAPDPSSPSAAQIASGTSVTVLRSAGDWRYVRDGRSGTEGWVDGRFLAGQAMSSDLATLSREDLTHRR